MLRQPFCLGSYILFCIKDTVDSVRRQGRLLSNSAWVCSIFRVTNFYKNPLLKKLNMAFGFSCRTNRIFLGQGPLLNSQPLLEQKGKQNSKISLIKLSRSPFSYPKKRLVPLFFKKATSLYSSIHRQRPMLVLKVTRN